MLAIAVSALLKPGPDSKVHGANMGPTWVLSAQDGPYVGPMNLAIMETPTKWRCHDMETGPLWGEGHRSPVDSQKISDAEISFFAVSLNKLLNKQMICR